MHIENIELFRENICKKLTCYFTNTSMDDICINKTAANIEKGVFNYAIKEANARKIVKKWENPYFKQLYIDRLRVIYINLKNQELIQQLESGELTPNILAYMSHQEMNPKHWKEMIDRKTKRDESKFSTRVEASTDMFTCKKCKSKRCTYYELQTRSADEPATIFITCLDCGKNYKM